MGVQYSGCVCLLPPGLSVCLQGDQACPQHVRVDLTSENDLFFHYTHRWAGQDIHIYAHDNERNPSIHPSVCVPACLCVMCV